MALSSTSLRIRDAAESSQEFVTFIVRTPSRFIIPDITSEFFAIFLGMLSPVRAEVSRELSPSIMIPSRGIRSYGFTIIISSG